MQNKKKKERNMSTGKNEKEQNIDTIRRRTVVRIHAGNEVLIKHKINDFSFSINNLENLCEDTLKLINEKSNISKNELTESLCNEFTKENGLCDQFIRSLIQKYPDELVISVWIDLLELTVRMKQTASWYPISYTNRTVLKDIYQQLCKKPLPENLLSEKSNKNFLNEYVSKLKLERDIIVSNQSSAILPEAPLQTSVDELINDFVLSANYNMSKKFPNISESHNNLTSHKKISGNNSMQSQVSSFCNTIMNNNNANNNFNATSLQQKQKRILLSSSDQPPNKKPRFNSDNDILKNIMFTLRDDISCLSIEIRDICIKHIQKEKNEIDNCYNSNIQPNDSCICTYFRIEKILKNSDSDLANQLKLCLESYKHKCSVSPSWPEKQQQIEQLMINENSIKNTLNLKWFACNYCKRDQPLLYEFIKSKTIQK